MSAVLIIMQNPYIYAFISDGLKAFAARFSVAVVGCMHFGGYPNLLHSQLAIASARKPGITAACIIPYPNRYPEFLSICKPSVNKFNVY
jgi:hypothetical protein